jgi:hypothetical protein
VTNIPENVSHFVLTFIIFNNYITFSDSRNDFSRRSEKHTVACRPVARQQIPKTHQRTKLEAVFSTRSVTELRDATIEDPL